MMIRQYESYLKKEKYGVSTIKSYLSIARQYMNYAAKTKKNQYEIQSINDFLAFKYKKVSSNTFRKYYAGLHQYFLFLQGQGNISLNTTYPRIKLPQVEDVPPVIVTKKEVYEIAKKIPVKSVALAVLIMFHTGVRLTECLNIRRKDINFKRQQLTVVEGKGAKKRVVDLSHEICLHISQYLKEHDTNTKTNVIALEDYLIQTSRTSQVSTSYFQSLLYQAQIELKRSTFITAHDLRHSYAHWHLLKNENLLLLKQQLGHSSLATTEKYIYYIKVQYEQENRLNIPKEENNNGVLF